MKSEIRNPKPEANGGGHRPAATRYARNAEQLARAFGRNLSPRKRKASLAEVNGWISCADFPRKNPPSKGWVVEEVARWLEQVRSPKSEVRNETPALPVQADGGKPGDLFGPELGFEQTLDLWEDKLKNPMKWQESPIQKWQMEELKRHRRQLFPGNAEAAVQKAEENMDLPAGHQPHVESAPLPDSESQKALAVRLAKHFQGRITIDISEQQISKWKSGEVPPGIPLPPAKLGNRFDTQAWADWIGRWIMPRHGVKTDGQGRLEPSVFDLADEADARRKIDEARIKQIEREVAEGKYIERALAERLAAGLAREYHEFWKARIERGETEAIRQFLGTLAVGQDLVEKIVAFVSARARDFVAAVEDKCAEQAAEFAKKLTADERR